MIALNYIHSISMCARFTICKFRFKIGIKHPQRRRGFVEGAIRTFRKEDEASGINGKCVVEGRDPSNSGQMARFGRGAKGTEGGAGVFIYGGDANDSDDDDGAGSWLLVVGNPSSGNLISNVRRAELSI